MRGFALNVHSYVMYPVKDLLNFNTSKSNGRACAGLLLICTVRIQNIRVLSTTMLIFRRTVVLVQHLVSPLSLGDRSDHSLLQDSRNLCIEQSPKESDDTRCCTNTIVLLNMSTLVLETCRRI